MSISSKNEMLEAFGLNLNDPAVLEASEDFSEFADLISEMVAYRKCMKVSQFEVGSRMGTSQAAVSNIERVGGNPTVETLFRYARAVGMRLRFVAEVVGSMARADELQEGSRRPEAISVVTRSTNWTVQMIDSSNQDHAGGSPVSAGQLHLVA